MVKNNTCDNITCDIGLLNRLFAYDPETGVVTRKIAVGRRVKAGQVVGCKWFDRYLIVKIEGRNFQLHRVIWAMQNGNWPDGKEIDHIDGNGLNNRIANMREATRQQNQRNRKFKERDLPRGVYRTRNGKSFRVKLQIDGSKRDFGTYATVEAAAAVAEQKRRESHGEFFFEQTSKSGWPSSLRHLSQESRPSHG